MRPKDAGEGFREVDEGYDARELEINDFFNDPAKCKDVLTCASSRTKAGLIVPEQGLYVVSDAVQKQSVVQLSGHW